MLSTFAQAQKIKTLRAVSSNGATSKLTYADTKAVYIVLHTTILLKKRYLIHNAAFRQLHTSIR